MRYVLPLLVVSIAALVCGLSSPTTNDEEFPCYAELRKLGNQQVMKERGPFTQEELDIFEALYKQVVLPSLIPMTTWDVPRPIEFVLTLATSREREIAPPDDFIARITTDSVIVRAPMDTLYQQHWCQLSFFAWYGPDTAHVSADVRWHSWNARYALAIRVDDSWKVCPGAGVASISYGAPSPRSSSKQDGE